MAEKKKLLMVSPSLIRECTSGSRRNSRKTMKLPPRLEMRPDSLHWVQSNALFPIEQVRSLDVVDGTTESPPEIPHKCRRTLMSLQECEIFWCSPNQLEMMTNSPAFASEQCPIPHHTGQLSWLPLGKCRDSLTHPLQVYRNTNLSTGTCGKLHVPRIISRRELIPRILLKS